MQEEEQFALQTAHDIDSAGSQYGMLWYVPLDFAPLYS